MENFSDSKMKNETKSCMKRKFGKDLKPGYFLECCSKRKGKREIDFDGKLPYSFLTGRCTYTTSSCPLRVQIQPQEEMEVLDERERESLRGHFQHPTSWGKYAVCGLRMETRISKRCGTIPGKPSLLAETD